MHEAALKAQAKKMNVESLRSGDQSGESAEVKIAKVLVSLLISIYCQGIPEVKIFRVLLVGGVTSVATTKTTTEYTTKAVLYKHVEIFGLEIYRQRRHKSRDATVLYINNLSIEFKIAKGLFIKLLQSMCPY